MTKKRRPRTPAASPWWSAHVHTDRRHLLYARSKIKAAIRTWFEGRGFVEVDPACLQVSPGNETHLHAFKTELVGTDLARTPLYLHTSPEIAMKKLLAAGERRIFSFSPVFRNRERGPLHAPEFMMLEWYRANETVEDLWNDCAAMLRLAARVTERTRWTWRDSSCDVGKDYDFTSLDRAFAELADVPLSETYGADSADRDKLAALAVAKGYTVARDDSWSDIFSKILTEAIEPCLGRERPEFLHDYPVHEAAMARRLRDYPQLAERFELYVCGIEIANGFGELTDATEQQRRLEQQMDLKERLYGERYPVDEDFIAALSKMPPAAGCALGFDRLVMLATGATSVEQVIWTPLAAPAVTQSQE